MPIRNIFFDIGFTLLFQNTSITLAPLLRAGFRPTQQQLYSAEKFAKLRLDEAHARPGKGKGSDFDFWGNYHWHLMQNFALNDDLIFGELILLSRTSANWTRPAEGIPALLEELRKTYTLGVISNADGKLERSLEKLGLKSYFATVTDSGVVGHDKPSPAIFQTALAAQNAEARESIYVGDILSLDYNGARSAGMHSLLIDVAGVYSGQAALERIPNFSQFSAALAKIASQ